jgi:hypothetical protein
MTPHECNDATRHHHRDQDCQRFLSGALDKIPTRMPIRCYDTRMHYRYWCRNPEVTPEKKLHRTGHRISMIVTTVLGFDQWINTTSLLSLFTGCTHCWFLVIILFKLRFIIKLMIKLLFLAVMIKLIGACVEQHQLGDSIASQFLLVFPHSLLL